MAQVDRTGGLTGMKGIKDPVKAVAITSIALAGAQTVNGVAVVAGDRVLVTAQTSAVDNGVYDVATGNWTRAKDFNGTKDITVGTIVPVENGNQYRVDSGSVIGTDSIVFQLVSWQANYDIALTAAGVPASSQVIGVVPMVRAITFDVALALSQGAALVAATAETVFSIQKNGTEFGTATFAAAGTTATFAAATPPSFAAGDVLTIVAPAVADATLADVGFTLAAQVV